MQGELNIPVPSASPEQLRSYQRILADFGRMAAEASEVSSLLQLAAVQAMRATGVRHSKVVRYRPEAGDLLIVAGVGWNDGVVGRVTIAGDPGTAAGQTLHTRQPVIIHDVAEDPDLRTPVVLREHGIISLVNAPIAIDGLVWGVLEVDSDTPRRFGEDDATFLLAMGNILGLALQGRMAVERSNQEGTGAAAALTTQKILLRELEHRFKNDFQLIQSLLAMQRRKQQDEGLRRDLRHVMDRVAAIGIAHDQLSGGGAHGSVGIADYLNALCGNLGQRRDNVRVEADAAELPMPHERAVPIGLIVNELVTNAFKHAYPGDDGGTIRVTFTTPGNGEGILCVQDDGVGMGPPRQGSSGTDLVGLLVKQIGGQIEPVKQEKGAGFRVNFPLVT